MVELNMPTKISDCGIDKIKYMETIETLSDKAFEDQCTPANPRLPLVNDLKEIYRKAF
jgi:acetaldehyde dehydrogenase / alcohol dehydrogenase